MVSTHSLQTHQHNLMITDDHPFAYPASPYPLNLDNCGNQQIAPKVQAESQASSHSYQSYRYGRGSVSAHFNHTYVHSSIQMAVADQPIFVGRVGWYGRP
jgi:hypothetical protein